MASEGKKEAPGEHWYLSFSLETMDFPSQILNKALLCTIKKIKKRMEIRKYALDLSKGKEKVRVNSIAAIQGCPVDYNP